MRRLVALATITAAVAACKSPGSPTPTASASASASAAPRPDLSVAAKSLLAAEHRRASADVTDAHLSDRDVTVRRHAARALARIADARAVELLRKSLADEDLAVVSWSAYGLGYACKGHESETVRALAARAATLSAAPKREPSKAETLAESLESPWFSVTDALARCGTREAERTLRAWLAPMDGRSEAAALALGRLANTKKRLDDASLVALLDAASSDQPLENALFAFGRLSTLTPSVQKRLIEVAKQALGSKGRQRVFAIRALGRAGPDAVEPLANVLTNAELTVSERADAAHGLAKMGDGGQVALATALTQLAPKAEGFDGKELLKPSWSVLAATLGGLEPPARKARQALDALSQLPIPDGAGKAIRRRVVALRCNAAALRAGTASLYKKLVDCDPEDGSRAKALAVLRVLDRGALTGTRLRRWAELAGSKDPVVRQRAIGLMPAHPEIRNPHLVLTAALQAKETGTVSSAAEVLSAYPDRSMRQAAERRGKDDGAPKTGTQVTLDPDKKLVDALGKALEADRPPDEIEVRSAIMDAAAALQLLSLKPKIEPYCKSDKPTLRLHAEKALRLFGEKQRSCTEFTPPKAPPPEVKSASADKIKLVVQTDSGEHSMTLDPSIAPITVARIVSLVDAGFYEGIVVHRVVPGFVAQFGDPGGDGYGGAGKEPLRCETSPVEYSDFRVGVALGGRDTGSSQLFVTLGPFPHLDGNYPLIGTASPRWTSVAQGDTIEKVRVAE